MKRIILFISLLAAVQIQAQTDALNYQAVIIDNSEDEIPGLDISGNYLSETMVSLRFTIIDELENSEYQEIQSTMTDRYGMINVRIGQGEMTSESAMAFTEINWDGTPRQLSVDLAIEDGDFTEFSKEELLFVPYAYHRNVIATGTLDVDGESTLNNSLTVTNQSPTLMTGDLTVEGDGFFNTITVENLSDLQSDVQVGGNTTMQGELSVLNESPASFTGSTTVGGQFAVANGSMSIMTGNALVMGNAEVDGNTNIGQKLTVDGESELKGQVIIDVPLNGNDTNRDAYPLLVQGADQGIDIRLNGATNSNNFLTFRSENSIRGSIEAQSFSDLQDSFEYDWEFALYVIDIAFMTAEGIACAFQFDYGESGIIAANILTYGVHYQNRENYVVDNYGIYFKSGGADYAEYLEKADRSEIFHKGDIVGVVGGKISKQVDDADHVMVVSTAPIVLGNMPAEGEEGNFEKVAFLGQVPVRVVGTVEVGDYILPSGNNDGLGIAKSPEDMEIDDYSKILGVAWESSRSDLMSVVNVAVGINKNDISAKVSEQQQQIDALQAQLDQILARLDGREVPSLPVTTAKSPTQVASPTKAGLLLSEADFDEWLNEYGYIFEYYMGELKAEYERRGINYQKHPEIVSLINDPKSFLKEMYKGENMPTLWQGFVEKYPDQFLTE